MNGKLFGTDGIRGPANVEPVTAATLLRIGQAAVRLFREQSTGRPSIVVGKDTRISGGMLEAALAAGASAMGADVWLAGVLPTPAIAFLTRQERAAAGAVISASHNPFSDNGIKFFGPDGFKLPDAIESRIEELVRDAGPSDAPTGDTIGRVSPMPDAAPRYIEALRAPFAARAGLNGLKLVLDCSNGAGFAVAPSVFESLGAVVSLIGAQPNGVNINEKVGAVHPQQLQKAVLAAGADMGLALDGDADRAILVDETGAIIDGDEVLAMVGIEMQARGTLRGNSVVATVMSNIGLEIALRAHGINLLRTPVGDRYVVEEMQRGGFNLGGEQSGHLLFLDSGTTGDGIAAGLQVAYLMMEKQRPLSALKTAMSKFPQTLVNVRVRERRDLAQAPAVTAAIERVAKAVDSRGRVLVRYSGTEPLLRVMVEGENEQQVRAYAEEIAEAIRRDFA